MSQAVEYYKGIFHRVPFEDSTNSISKSSLGNIKKEVIWNWINNEANNRKEFQQKSRMMEHIFPISSTHEFTENLVLQSGKIIISYNLLSVSLIKNFKNYYWNHNRKLMSIFALLIRKNLKYFSTTNVLSLSEILKGIPNLTVSDDAFEYISQSQYQIKRIIQITKKIQEIEKSSHTINILQGSGDESKIIQYLIPTPSRKERLSIQEKIVNHILESIPNEDFIDFMVKVYFEAKG